MNINKKMALNSLWALGIKEERIENLDVILLPENQGSTSDFLYDAQDTITISKLLKEKGVACANSYDLELDLPTIDRKSSDIWVGQLFILNDFVLPLVIGVFQNYLQPLISQRKERKDNRAPAADVHTEIKFFKDDEETSIIYKGDPETLIKILQTLKKEDNHD
jgi:hypothetical protein